MQYKEQYHSLYKDLVETGSQTVYTKDINQSNIDEHVRDIINILKDGIETPEVQSMMVTVVFTDGIDCRLTIFDYWSNLAFWHLNGNTNEPITSNHIVFFENITQGEIMDYINNLFIDKYRRKLTILKLNNSIDDIFGSFRELKQFQPYLSNTLNLKDTIDLMNKYPEFNDTIHFDITGIPIEDLKDKGMAATRTQIKYIINSDHCLRDSFRVHQAVSDKQYKEVQVNIGTKPDGQGGVFIRPIAHSYINGGLSTPSEVIVDSSVGRIAQILSKTNVGESGAFARQLELNNMDTKLNPDPNYICNTHHFEEITIENDIMLNMYNLRYYRTNPNGVDYLLRAKVDKHLIGKKLYFRSPMTCDSAAKGLGICYKCYGDLAYTNQEVNIGQIAAEGLSSIYTQILLSAKHLLESLVVKMEWNEEFKDLFAVTFNSIALKNDTNYRGFALIIDEEIKSEEEIDDVSYNYYINGYSVRYPDGHEVRIHTKESDNIYFDSEFYKIVMDNASKDENDEFYCALDMNKLSKMDIPVMFVMEIRNNELSATMKRIEKLIDNKSVIAQYDRNSILKEFITTNMSGGIKLNAVHFEVLLMNQIRAADDILELPDWSLPTESYQILTLSKSLSDNRSIAIRFQNSRLSKTLNNPMNHKLKAPSVMDLYYMEQPQGYLNNDGVVSDEYRPKSDVEQNIVQPIRFENPKVRAGRTAKKRKVTKSERE